MQNTAITTRQAAQALGVSEASLKRWCDQGLLPALRTPGGHRRLPLSGVVQFMRERQMGSAQPRVLGLPGCLRSESRSASALSAAMQDALEAGDECEVRRLLFGLFLAGSEISELLDSLIVPSFRAMGDKWSHGDLAVYEERRAVELCTRLLHQLQALLPAPTAGAPRAIGGTLTGDPYSLPTTMMETALWEAGWRSQSYGCGLTAATLVEALCDIHPKLLWISASYFDAEEQFLADYATVYDAANELGVAVLVGGRMLTARLRERMQYSAYGDNLRHAVAFARVIRAPVDKEREGVEERQ
jgi:excisionase family DNA binding protein